ncbi:MAG: reverse transcriptase domain-containing protein [Planctomycetota bacterium]
MARQRTNPEDLWRAIEQAGSIDAYVDAQLLERGYVIKAAGEEMSKRECDEYKKQLKAEAAERKKLKKEAWQAYRSKHIVHLGEGVFWNDFTDYDKWDLENAEKRAAENSLPAIDSPAQLAEKLNLTIPQLRWLAFHRDAATSLHYRRFTIAKRDGSERPIWAPLPKLKKAQHWILYNIAERLRVHGSAHGFLAGRSIATNASVHSDSKTILKMDLREFFPTVTLPRVKGIFRKAGYREQVATLLALVCSEAPREIVKRNGKTYYVSLGPRCLPQGAPTSPALSNTVCFGLDARLEGLARKFGWRYSRYADDMTFSLPKNHKGAPGLGALIGLVRKTVAAEGFQVNNKKTNVVRCGARQRVTGLVVNGEHEPRTQRSVRRNIRAAIHNLKLGKSLKEGETMESLRGMIAFISMTQRELGQKLSAELKAAVSG